MSGAVSARRAAGDGLLAHDRSACSARRAARKRTTRSSRAGAGAGPAPNEAETGCSGESRRRCGEERAQIPAEMWEGVSPGPGADVAGVSCEPSSGADVGGGEPSPGADVGGAHKEVKCPARLGEEARFTRVLEYSEVR